MTRTRCGSHAQQLLEIISATIRADGYVLVPDQQLEFVVTGRATVLKQGHGNCRSVDCGVTVAESPTFRHSLNSCKFSGATGQAACLIKNSRFACPKPERLAVASRWTRRATAWHLEAVRPPIRKRPPESMGKQRGH